MKTRILILIIISALFTACDTKHRQKEKDKIANYHRNPFKTESFLYGVDFYPELLTKAEWMTMLDTLQEAHVNCIRFAESSWGNLEPAEGKYNFGWVREFLDELQKRNIKAILGTNTFISPQWLTAGHPEILVKNAAGEQIHPMSRKAACINHPMYREACKRFIKAFATEFKDHPAVMGWQLDNEVEWVTTLNCHNDGCWNAWQKWLKKTYHTPEELNEKLFLKSWGMQINDFKQFLFESNIIDGDLPVLKLAHMRFAKDLLAEFLTEQVTAIRESGAKQWITSDWNTTWNGIANEPFVQEIADVSAVNFYPSLTDAHSLLQSTYYLDEMRSVHLDKHFLVTETNIAQRGNSALDEYSAEYNLWKLGILTPVAYGSNCLMYWSGNRWRGGHWPHWGGVFDWSGKPELDFEWVKETGTFLHKWSKDLTAYTVKSDVAVLTDFNLRSCLYVYQHFEKSTSILSKTFEIFHRMGIGVDAINQKDASLIENLKKYKMIVLSGASCFDNKTVVDAMKQYVSNGGVLLVLPLTSYQDDNGIFRKDGFGANFSELTGGYIRTIRWVGTNEMTPEPTMATWNFNGMKYSSPLQYHGFCEIFELPDKTNTKIIAEYKSPQAIVNNLPAATCKDVGKGKVFKIGFMPADSSLQEILSPLLVDNDALFNGILPDGVQVIPHTDNTIFIINTLNRDVKINLSAKVKDRISGDLSADKTIDVKKFQVLWLEKI